MSFPGLNEGYPQDQPPAYTQQKQNLPPPNQPGYGYVQGPPVQTNQTNVVMVNQPQPSTTFVVTPVPETYLGLSLFSCLCCVWPIGLVALIFSCMAQSARDTGNFEEARSQGQVAKWTALASVILGIILIVVLIVIFTTGVVYVN